MASLNLITFGSSNDLSFVPYLIGPWGFDYSLKLVNFKLISMINNFCEVAIRWMPQHLTDHLSTLVQVMAWCHQATSHYLSQCWPRSLSPYDVTRPQWGITKANTDLSIQPLQTIFDEIWLKPQPFSYKKRFQNVIYKMSAIYLGINILTCYQG